MRKLTVQLGCRLSVDTALVPILVKRCLFYTCREFRIQRRRASEQYLPGPEPFRFSAI